MKTTLRILGFAWGLVLGANIASAQAEQAVVLNDAQLDSVTAGYIHRSPYTGQLYHYGTSQHSWNTSYTHPSAFSAVNPVFYTTGGSSLSILSKYYGSNYGVFRDYFTNSYLYGIGANQRE